MALQIATAGILLNAGGLALRSLMLYAELSCSLRSFGQYRYVKATQVLVILQCSKSLLKFDTAHYTWYCTEKGGGMTPSLLSAKSLSI